MPSMPGFGSVAEPRQFTKFLSTRIDDEVAFSLEGVAAAALPAGQGWEERIDTAHRAAKANFRYVRDKAGDVWSLPSWRRIRSLSPGGFRWIAEGDCEDWGLYMITQLLDIEVPPGALRLAECRTEAGEGHAVLSVEMSDTTLVSDVRKAGVAAWDASLFEGYEWFIRQQPGERAWQRIGRAPTLADLVGGGPTG